MPSSTLRVLALLATTAALFAAGGVRASGGAASAGAQGGRQASASATKVARARPAHPKPPSTSLGQPNDGRLLHGRALPRRGPGFRFANPHGQNERYGMDEVVRAIVRAARITHRRFGGQPLVVNDLSRRGGGPLDHHSSHQSGRDVDVLFYETDPRGRPVRPVQTFFDPEGHAVDFRDLSDPSDDVPLRFDTARTFAFLRALVEDPRAGLQRVFIVEHLRARLLAYGKAHGAPAAVLERLGAVTCQPGPPHDDHMHLRFFCSPQDVRAGCRDMPPMYPWHRALLASRHVEPLRAKRPRPSARAKTVSPEQARSNAGPMNAEVRGWLERRETWRHRPHPGRPWCR